MSSQLFPFDQDVYICHVYIPPSDSRVSSSSNTDLYDQLEQDIIKYNDLGKIFVSGDLNAHTSTAVDYFEYDKFLDQNLIFYNKVDIPSRANKDRVLDYYGRYLLELCQCTGLLIANGRLFNDKNIGNYTFCSHQGKSTVDYLLLNFCDFGTLSHFEISEFNEFSDHAPLSFNIYLNNQNPQHENLNTQTDTEVSRKIVWDDEKIDHFKQSLSNANDCIQRMTTDISNEPVDDVVKNFTQFLHDKAFDTFGKTFGSKNGVKHKKPNKRWFDENCKNAKLEFTRVRNMFNRNKNDENRRKFTRSRTKYNHVKYRAQKKYKLSEGKRLNDLARKDSKKFWKNIKKTYKKAGPSSDSLNIDQLHEHFQNMFGDHTELNQNNEHQTEPNLQSNAFNEDFDADFTLTELSRAVYSQNNNKTPGMDSIPSEIIKASYDNISTFLLKLYNKMYNTGEYPRMWGESIIHPIFKKGDANDPQNYRGITLINVLAKIYSQLLLNRLTKWSTENETITDNQFGFQKR